MSNFKRETIVLVGAIVGANLLAFFNQPKPVRSLDCFQSLGNAWSGATSKPVSKDGVRTDIPYYENDPWANANPQTHAAVVPVAPTPVARTPISAPVPAPAAPLGIDTSAMDRALDEQIAREHGQTLAQYRDSLQQGGAY